MSAQTVLLSVFVLAGLGFVLLLMAGKGQGAVMGGETKIRNIALGPVRTAAVVLHPDRAGAAVATCRPRDRGTLLGVRGDVLC